jgi:tetratricopeptide (TPR) repeat protein/predicted Ser/Thr protein kinase
MSGQTQMQPSGARVGRHVVIEQLGAGGMGIVYAAYDPQLDRKIAIKVLRARGSDKASTALLREAKAMARVSHPNVIAVFDVGVEAGDVYIAMEFVQGQNLRTWLKAQQQPKPWRDVLRVLMPAGRGLAAAHEAGLVHGDFKPDNVLLSDQGAVRVMDFGLARPGRMFTTTPDANASFSDTELTQGTYGTPAYMSPEQFANLPPDERSDQFSYCVALFEALFGERPFVGTTMAILSENVTAGRIRVPPRSKTVPAWLMRVVLRGLSPEPEDRWPAMKELLVALRSDPTRRRKYYALGGMLAFAVAGTGAALWTQHELLVRSCDDAGASVREIWGDTQRDELADAFVASGTAHPMQVHETTVPWLDRYADGWAQARTQTCVAGRIDETLDDYESTRDCLDDLRADFETRVGMLLVADDALAQRSVQLVSSLPRIETCMDASALRSRPRAPADGESIERIQATRRQLIAASAHHAAGKYDAGKELAAQALVEAEAIGWSPLVAEAQLQLGELLESAGQYDDAERTLQRAALLAAEIQHDAVAADAAIDLVQVTGDRKANIEIAEHWAAWSRVFLLRLDEIDGMRGADFHNALGTAYTAAGRFAEAAVEMQAAVDKIEAALGEGHPEAAPPLNNLAVVLRELGRFAEAEAVHRRELALCLDTLGADHIGVALSRVNFGSVLHAQGKYPEAEAQLRQALDVLERGVGADHPNTSAARANLGAMLFEQGEYDEALVHQRRALAARERTLGAEHPETARSLNGIATILQAQGQHADALIEHRRALAIFEKALGPDHPTTGGSRNNIASSLFAMGELEAAVDEHRRALAVWEKSLGDDHEMVAQARTNLAMVLLELARPEEALALAEQAWSRRSRGDVPPESEGLTAFVIAQATWILHDDEESRARAREMGATAVEALTRAGAAHEKQAASARAWVAAHAQ